MTHKLINAETGEEHLCEKVKKDGFDYFLNSKKLIATNNPNYNTPKVVDEAYELAFNFYESIKKEYYSSTGQKAQLPKTDKEFRAMEDGFIAGYKKSQQTHPFSEEDMIEFAKYLSSQMDDDGLILNPNYIKDRQLFVTGKQLFELWKSQKTQTIYFK